MFKIENKEEIKTIQTKGKLNTVYRIGKRGNGEAFRKYSIEYDKFNNGYISSNNISFQNGARNEENSTHGVLDTDLLEIVRDRLICFQSGRFASPYNELALRDIESALNHMNNRVKNRIKRKVLGTNKL